MPGMMKELQDNEPNSTAEGYRETMIVETGACQHQKYHDEASHEIEREQPLRVILHRHSGKR